VTGSDAVALPALVRWTNLVGFAAVVGSLATEVLVLPREAAELDGIRERLRRLLLASLGLLVAASGADLIVRARTMTGDGIVPALSALPLVLGRTHFGAIWRLRAWGVALVVFLCALRRPLAHAGALVVMLAVVFTLAASGHAGDWGDFTMAAFVDWVHASAAFLWGGALCCVWCCVFRAPPATLSSVALATVARRFSRLAGVCVCAIVLSGIANGCVEVGAIAGLWTSAYGLLLLAKLALVAGTLALGARNRYRVLPGLAAIAAHQAGDERDPTPDSLRAMLARYVAGEVLLVAVVFGCTAVIVQLPPPRHGDGTHQMAHPMSADSAPR
jgi:putative copper resistance protein D